MGVVGEALTFNVDDYLTSSNCHKINRITTSVSEFKVLIVKKEFFPIMPAFITLADHVMQNNVSLNLTI